ncbi:hypothetical protein CEXT_334451 [Caerostris extrusa]|uniref:Uncharacterized protein n=1 Tax=Caerostris extrusa TaxID=172846 RepID=A0AAV4WY21_CAEEX|nr:hypothetical protein CEXT_334451 [Caerostris extrusa]
MATSTNQPKLPEFRTAMFHMIPLNLAALGDWREIWSPSESINLFPLEPLHPVIICWLAGLGIRSKHLAACQVKGNLNCCTQMRRTNCLESTNTGRFFDVQSRLLYQRVFEKSV